jgi:hypothetical protein
LGGGLLVGGTDGAGIDAVVEEPGGRETRWRAETNEGREMSFLTVDGATGRDDRDEVSGPGYFCDVPAE